MVGSNTYAMRFFVAYRSLRFAAHFLSSSRQLAHFSWTPEAPNAGHEKRFILLRLTIKIFEEVGRKA